MGGNVGHKKPGLSLKAIGPRDKEERLKGTGKNSLFIL
jgi:hypothetical protein